MSRQGLTADNLGATLATVRVRQSLLAILAEARYPMRSKQLAAAHCRYDAYINTHLNALQRVGAVVRQRPVEPAASAFTYWWSAGRALGSCAICCRPATGFVPPMLDVEDVRGPASPGGLDQLLWREITEVCGTGGWVCADRAHARQLLRAGLTSHTPAGQLVPFFSVDTDTDRDGRFLVQPPREALTCRPSR